MALADEDSPAFMLGGFQHRGCGARRRAASSPRRSGPARASAGTSTTTGCSRAPSASSARATAANLVDAWIPALDGRRGEAASAARKVADVGCGHGASTIIMAAGVSRSRRSSASTTTTASIEARPRRGRGGGVADRVAFEVAGAKDYPGTGYDLVVLLRLPARHGRSGRRARATSARRSPPDGTWMLVEPFAGDRVEDNLNPVGRVYYCGLDDASARPARSTQEVGLALGAQAGEARLARGRREAGFTPLPARDRDAVQPGARGPGLTIWRRGGRARPAPAVCRPGCGHHSGRWGSRVDADGEELDDAS